MTLALRSYGGAVDQVSGRTGKLRFLLLFRGSSHTVRFVTCKTSRPGPGPGPASTNFFYALTALFQTSITSICQLLNLVETMINTSTGYNQSKSQDYKLGNRPYHQDILCRLGLRLRENILDLEDHRSPQY